MKEKLYSCIVTCGGNGKLFELETLQLLYSVAPIGSHSLTKRDLPLKSYFLCDIKTRGYRTEPYLFKSQHRNVKNWHGFDEKVPRSILFNIKDTLLVREAEQAMRQ
jgi:hypothetical protein